MWSQICPQRGYNNRVTFPLHIYLLLVNYLTRFKCFKVVQTAAESSVYLRGGWAASQHWKHAPYFPPLRSFNHRWEGRSPFRWIHCDIMPIKASYLSLSYSYQSPECKERTWTPSQGHEHRTVLTVWDWDDLFLILFVLSTESARTAPVKITARKHQKPLQYNHFINYSNELQTQKNDYCNINRVCRGSR